MTEVLIMVEVDYTVADATLQLWTVFTQLSETDNQFREFILSIPTESDDGFMHLNLVKAREICLVIEAKIAAEAALADLNWMANSYV